MKIYKNLKTERRKRVIEILTKGISRVIDSTYKSSNISDLDENRNSQIVAYQLDKVENKSVCKSHEN